MVISQIFPEYARGILATIEPPRQGRVGTPGWGTTSKTTGLPLGSVAATWASAAMPDPTAAAMSARDGATMSVYTAGFAIFVIGAMMVGRRPASRDGTSIASYLSRMTSVEGPPSVALSTAVLARATSAKVKAAYRSATERFR